MSTQVDWLQGRSIQAVHFDEETGEWIFDFGEHHVLQVAAPWRLLKEARIELGQCDHNRRFGPPAPVHAPTAVLEAVKGRSVVDASVADSTADLSVDFGAGVLLEVFNNSSGYEGWTLNAPGGRLLVAQGGGAFAKRTG
jgi:hypothetical protein